MPSYAISARVPVIENGAFVHPTAVLIGDVRVSDGCYPGAGAIVAASAYVPAGLTSGPDCQRTALSGVCSNSIVQGSGLPSKYLSSA